MKLYKEIPKIEDVVKAITAGTFDAEYILQQYAFSIIDKCADNANVIWNGAVDKDTILKVKNHV